MSTDWAARRNRFAKYPACIRMGHIASELSRLSKRVDAGDPDERILASMTLVAHMMDWMGPDATPEIADMQREICLWRRLWPVDGARPVLAFRARVMADELLRASGLLDANQSEPAA